MKANEINQWITNHKKELIISGIVIVAAGLTIVGAKNGDKIIKSLYVIPDNESSSIRKRTERLDFSQVAIEPVQTIDEVESVFSKRINVSEHIRNLPNGYNASHEKVVLSAEKGIILLPGQTIVEAYVKRGHVA